MIGVVLLGSAVWLRVATAAPADAWSDAAPAADAAATSTDGWSDAAPAGAGTTDPSADPSHPQTADPAKPAAHGDDHGDEGHGGAGTHGDDHGAHGDDHGGGHHGSNLGAELPLWSAIPFVGILLSIALFPLLAPQFWHHHFGKISTFWALLFGIPFLTVYGSDAFHEISHIYLLDYIPFIILLWALFTVAGGIVIRGNLNGSPMLNTVFLLIGTLIASWVGTTGASMVLIRPVLRANAWRRHKVHVVVFFIFLVSNIGGALTPLGDPPLFLGFLHSVPFFWTLKLTPHLIFVATFLLIGFYFLDRYYFTKEDQEERARQDEAAKQAGGGVKIVGLQNAPLLAGVVAAVLMSGLWKPGIDVTIFGTHVAIQNLARDGLLIMLGLASLWLTSSELRKENEFTWFPIQEVAILFAGIFMTIIPALAILKAGSEGALAGLVAAVQEPWQYFWVTGVLSSFLDNAPTYLTFFNTALGGYYPGVPEAEAVARVIATPEHALILAAISAGAVFMGACTYIGNAPNFMVKSIAEEAGVAMPSFFGYMKWSVVILLPVFVLVTLVFFL